MTKELIYLTEKILEIEAKIEIAEIFGSDYEE